jgi:YTV
MELCPGSTLFTPKTLLCKWTEFMRSDFRTLLTFGLAIASVPTCNLRAQICCEPAYSVQSQTVWEEQLEERLRVVYRTVWEEQEVTSLMSVPKTRIEKRQYTVSKPVVETSTVEEKYTVMRPVTKREWEDRSYQETTYVTETAEREEAYLSYRPTVETQYQTQQYLVQRPVTETQMQTRQYTAYQPVTTLQSAVVDQGQYVAQQYYQPGDVRYGLRYMPGGLSVDPTGQAGYRRGGFGWVPYTSPGNTFAQLQYQPNPVQVTVPQTSLVPQVLQQQVPVQVTRMQTEVVQQQVPVSVTKMQPVEERRRVPYSVQKPVTRYVENKVPVDKVEWVEQEMVRPKTIQRTSYKLETQERDVTVHFSETQEVKRKVKVPRQVAEYEPYQVRRMVPRTVQVPNTLSYYDPYSGALSRSTAGWLPSAGDTVISYGAARPVMPDVSKEADSKGAESKDAEPKAGIKSMKVEGPNSEEVEPPAAELDLSTSAGDKASKT